VVASRVGAVPDILPVPEYGRIVPPCDAEALTEALQEVLQAEWLPEKIAPCPAVQSWDRVAREVEKVFVRVLRPSSSAGKMP
jgi:glycosyltransferase involved in cell wall biosynthesis